tara:strand:+ start:2753 stop:3325 length:573 start_codon:yes stop_codon:yes gene_type:complete
MTKIEIISELFLDFNRDPYKNKPLVEHYVKRLYECDITLLTRAIKELTNERDTLPRCKEILAKYGSFESKVESYRNNENCELCGDTGVILGVFIGKTVVTSLNYLPEGEYCYTSVTGRCSCDASKNWSPNLPDASPLSCIREYSKSEKLDCSMGASLLCTEINKRSRSCEKAPINNISRSTLELKEELPF